jgi:hypothetical protein
VGAFAGVVSWWLKETGVEKEMGSCLNMFGEEVCKKNIKSYVKGISII